MIHLRRHDRLALLIVLAWLALTVSARSGHNNNGGNSHNWGADEDGNDTDYDHDDDDDDFPSNSGSGFGGYRGGSNNNNNANANMNMPQTLLTYRQIHGILASLAMVALFPIGSILLRVVPARFKSVWVHAGVQALAWCVYVAAAGLGIYLVRVVRIPGGGLLGNPSTRYHPIIGLVLLALLVIQPAVGFIHHRVYKKVQRRQMWSYLHLTIGRLGITLGIINGGLGLYISNAPTRFIVAYSVVAAIIWALWMAVAAWAKIKRARRGKEARLAAAVKSSAGHEGEDKGFRYG